MKSIYADYCQKTKKGACFCNKTTETSPIQTHRTNGDGAKST